MSSNESKTKQLIDPWLVPLFAYLLLPRAAAVIAASWAALLILILLLAAGGAAAVGVVEHAEARVPGHGAAAAPRRHELPWGRVAAAAPSAAGAAVHGLHPEGASRPRGRDWARNRPRRRHRRHRHLLAHLHPGLLLMNSLDLEDPPFFLHVVPLPHCRILQLLLLGAMAMGGEASEHGGHGGMVGGAEGGGDGGEVGGDGAGAGGVQDGRLRLLQKPLHGLAVRLVSQLSGQLEHTGGAHRRHPDPPAPPIDLRMPVPAWRPLRRRRRHSLLLRLRHRERRRRGRRLPSCCRRSSHRQRRRRRRRDVIELVVVLRVGVGVGSARWRSRPLLHEACRSRGRRRGARAVWG